MSAPIFNRADFEHPADGWYQIEPKGTHPNGNADAVQVIDEAACIAIVNRFNADADAGKLSHGKEMLIDHEHFKYDQDKETTAYGWLSRLQNRADGIYGQIRWTATGQKAVDGGDLRFFSTEYDPKDLVILNNGRPARVRPMRLDGLSLTNMPNNKGGKPITNRRSARPDCPAESGNARVAQAAATQKIASLADREQQASGGSLASCYLRVMNREERLMATARGDAIPEQAPAAFAGRMLMQLAQGRKFPGLSQNLAFIRNRFPGLARMENRQAGFDALADMEPVAHDAYTENGSTPNAQANPQVKAMWPDFHKAMQALAVQYPDLGVEERWQKLKETCPEEFWEFVLGFDWAPEK